jgi:hypothetical protein
MVFHVSHSGLSKEYEQLNKGMSEKNVGNNVKKEGEVVKEAPKKFVAAKDPTFGLPVEAMVEAMVEGLEEEPMEHVDCCEYLCMWLSKKDDF